MTTQAEVTPALFEQSTELYEAMSERATMQKAFHGDEIDTLVYDGHLTRLVTDNLHYSVPYYTKLTTILKDMDCIRQIRRGGSTTTSRWLLLQPPTLEIFTEAYKKSKTNTSWRNSIEQRIRDLTERLDKAGL